MFPCQPHSLNFIGASAVSFFGFVQSLYNFFSGSTHQQRVTIKVLSVHYKEIITTLFELSSDKAFQLSTKMHKFNVPYRSALIRPLKISKKLTLGWSHSSMVYRMSLSCSNIKQRNQSLTIKDVGGGNNIPMKQKWKRFTSHCRIYFKPQLPW